MLIDLQYRDDGFRVDVTLITREEQALADALIARDVWWPDRMDWVVFPVLALPRKRTPPRIPPEQKWSIQRMPSALTKHDRSALTQIGRHEWQVRRFLATTGIASPTLLWRTAR